MKKTNILYYKDKHTDPYISGTVLIEQQSVDYKWEVNHEGGTFIFYGSKSKLKTILKQMNLTLGEL